MRFFGSAMYFPHVDGGFTRLKWSKRRNVSLIRPKLTKRLGFCRTFSRRDSCRTSGRRVTGKRVFISGVGPIGCLIVSAGKHWGPRKLSVLM